jgi:hypothetical protein
MAKAIINTSTHIVALNKTFAPGEVVEADLSIIDKLVKMQLATEIKEEKKVSTHNKKKEYE